MEILTIILIIFVVSTLNVACFYIGAIVGQKVVKGETLEVPNLNPMEAYRAKEEKKEAQKEQDKVEAIMRNIERYDGTPYGQEEIPR